MITCIHGQKMNDISNPPTFLKSFYIYSYQDHCFQGPVLPALIPTLTTHIGLYFIECYTCTYMHTT